MQMKVIVEEYENSGTSTIFLIKKMEYIALEHGHDWVVYDKKDTLEEAYQVATDLAKKMGDIPIDFYKLA